MRTPKQKLPILGRCRCRPGIWRDNCSQCEGTGKAIDWREYHRQKNENRSSLEAAERAWARKGGE